jgi:hypothetical protein
LGDFFLGSHKFPLQQLSLKIISPGGLLTRKTRTKQEGVLNQSLEHCTLPFVVHPQINLLSATWEIHPLFDLKFTLPHQI